jgi:4-aminobutyrate aminotransferase
MMGVEIDHENASDVAESIMYSALARGLSFKLTMGNILLLVPALTLTREEMDAALEILTACFEEIV